jgi:hypothetical protein
MRGAFALVREMLAQDPAYRLTRPPSASVLRPPRLASIMAVVHEMGQTPN